ncbi:ABC transporter permease subunit [Nakamurella sp. YIM 132087]|uniref:ABC transporter permease subunit n=1 Tax=Nakamurella alba TaxID=2665158 RepID=A0A7K1FSP1_9ACTN|nr:ABC transporter permease [Nakamurella alba]MTD17172.1 ABC transporter permease subunit [Nakamurella alba]
MGRVILSRLLWSVGVLLVLSFVTFLMLDVIPGDPARQAAGENASDEAVERIRQEMGLDRPLLARYVSYLGGLVHGDFGTSVFTRQNVASDLASMAPVTLELVLVAMILTIVVGVGLGVLSALYKDTWIDGVIRSAMIFAGGLPAFWIGIVMQLVLSAKWGWFPLNGRIDLTVDRGSTITGMLTIDTLVQGKFAALGSAVGHLVLPALTLSLTYIPLVMRTIGANTSSQLGADYVTLGRAKGLGEGFLVTRYAMRNALIPTITLLGMQLGWMVGGTVLVESIFGLPGIGNYAVTAVLQKDLPAVVGVVLFVGLVFVLVNIVVDILCAALDPKLRSTVKS